MPLKSSTLIAIIGQVIALIWMILLNAQVIQWNPSIGLLVNVIGTGSMILFLVSLYVRQK